MYTRKVSVKIIRSLRTYRDSGKIFDLVVALFQNLFDISIIKIYNNQKTKKRKKNVPRTRLQNVKYESTFLITLVYFVIFNHS